MPKYLQQRRRRWYAVLEIPKRLRPKFNGKARFVRSLETESVSVAERRKLPVIHAWKEEIEAVRSGRPRQWTNEELELISWRDDLRRATPEERETLEEVVIGEIEDVSWRQPELAKRIKATVLDEGILLNEQIEEWLTSLADRNEAKTIDMKRADVSLLCNAFTTPQDVTKEDVISWIDGLEKAPGEPLGHTSKMRVISHCRGYWKYLQRKRVAPLDRNPFDQVIEKRGGKTKADVNGARKPFTDRQVVELLSAATDKGDESLAQLIWLAMWTGCRIEELCSLRLANVGEDRIEIEDAKTPSGWRTVPLHPETQSLVSRLSTSSADGYLLADLTNNKYGDRSNAIGKRFGRLKSSMGFGQQHVFHSIRKTVVTQLQNADVPEVVTANLMGHEIGTMTYGLYSGGASFEVLRDAIGKLSYPIQRPPLQVI